MSESPRRSVCSTEWRPDSTACCLRTIKYSRASKARLVVFIVSNRFHQVLLRRQLKIANVRRCDRRLTHAPSSRADWASVTKRKTPTTEPKPVPVAQLRREDDSPASRKRSPRRHRHRHGGRRGHWPHSRVQRSELSGVRQLVVEFVNAERDEMHAMSHRCLRVIEHALSARREYLTKDGQILHGGPGPLRTAGRRTVRGSCWRHRASLAFRSAT